MIEAPVRVGFDHTLYLLLPVGDGPGFTDIYWCFLDERSKWRAERGSLELLLKSDVYPLLARLLAYETRIAANGSSKGAGRNPNLTYARLADLPWLEPSLAIRITASLAEEEPDWRLEILDDSCWATEGYDLASEMNRLVDRLRDHSFGPARVLPLQPEEPAPPKQLASDSKVGELERTIYRMLGELDERVTLDEAKLAEIKQRMVEASLQRKALENALASVRRVYR